MLISANQIADTVGIRRHSIYSKEIDIFFETEDRTKGGRPEKLYRAEVLSLWGIDHTSLVRSNNTSLDRKNRNDASLPRKPKDMEQAERNELEARITELAKEKYLSQSLEKNIEGMVREAVFQICSELGYSKEELYKLARYYYKDRLIRKDAYYVGKAIAENWNLLWTQRFNKNAYNSQLPKNNWDYISFFEDVNLAGNGRGAGILWAIDATQMDVWVKSEGKVRLRSFYMIFDVLSGFPLAISLIESETAEKAVEIIAKAVSLWGVPKLGIILDNGAAFKSSYVQGFIDNLYTESEHKWLKTQSWHTKIFGHSNFQKYGLPRRPQFFGKAKLERAFEEINTKFISKYLPLAANPSTQMRQVSYELGTVPETQHKNAQDVQLIIQKLEHYLYSEYIEELRTIPSFKRKSGMMPTIANAWEYYGGLELINNKVAPPAENLPLHIYYSTHERNRHKTKAQFGSISFQENHQRMGFVGSFLNESLKGREVIAILHPQNPSEAMVYIRYDAKYYDARVPKDGDVAFIGIAYSNNIDSEDALSRRYQTQKTRNELDQQLKSKMPEFKPAKMNISSKDTTKNILTGKDDYKISSNSEKKKKEFDLSRFL